MKTVLLLIFFLNGQPIAAAPDIFAGGLAERSCSIKGIRWIEQHGADDPSMKVPTFYCAPVTIPEK